LAGRLGARIFSQSRGRSEHLHRSLGAVFALGVWHILAPTQVVAHPADTADPSGKTLGSSRRVAAAPLRGLTLAVPGHEILRAPRLNEACPLARATFRAYPRRDRALSQRCARTQSCAKGA